MGPRSIAASVRSVFSRATTESQPATDHSDAESVSSDDEESLFIYSRVADLPPTFYTTDAISSCLLTDSCHCYATHGGIVHMREPNGKTIRTVRVHRASVLNIDCDGKYVATASIDGTVVIASIADPLDTAQASFRRPVHCVSLHPDYTNHRAYVSGGTAGEVVLSERGWLKSRADTVLAHTQSTILAIAWVSTPQSSDTRVVWCNEEGITIYSPEKRAALNRVVRSNTGMRADLFRPRIHINKEAGNCVVAWARSIYVIDLKRGALKHQQELPFMLSGAVNYHQFMALLSVDPHSSGAELKLRNKEGIEVYADEIEPHAPHKLGSNDFHLAVQGGKVYVVSSNDVIVARERTNRDHVEWLVDRKRYVEAYQSASTKAKKELPSDDAKEHSGDEKSETGGSPSFADSQDEAFSAEEVRSIGLQATQQLIDAASYVGAARLLTDILQPEDNDWLLFMTQFLKNEQHLVAGDVLPNVPVGNVHNDVLAYALKTKSADHLTRWIKNWPLDVYDATKLATDMMEMDEQGELDAEMLVVYANLLQKIGDYVGAVKALVKADSPRAFGVVKHYHLWSEPPVLQILDSVLSSGYGDGGDGVFVARLRDLISVRAEIPPQKVVNQLRSPENELLLFGYLTELGLVDEPQLSQFADLMVEMYISYDRTKLLSFLERFDTYDLPKTIDLCREHKLVSELVYLLGRVGQTDEALKLIVTELKDYKRATLFAASLAPSQGSEVWDVLVQYCKTEPELVLELLKRVEISAAKVLQVVPADMRIHGLKLALTNVFREQGTSLELAEGTKAIVTSESKFWTRALRLKRAEGTVLSDPSSTFESLKPPILLSENGQCVAVPEFSRPVYTFGAKIAHLKQLSA